ncbi:hypothetical protein LIG30_3924 [Burkholderia sp. lig30]|nr:hypothetical protein LIG30_3924 [Burkholderia sp. lig30]
MLDARHARYPEGTRPAQRPIADVLPDRTPDVALVHATCRLVATRLAVPGLERLPVVHDAQSLRIAGIVSRSDLVKPALQHFDDEHKRERFRPIVPVSMRKRHAAAREAGERGVSPLRPAARRPVAVTFSPDQALYGADARGKPVVTLRYARAGRQQRLVIDARFARMRQIWRCPTARIAPLRDDRPMARPPPRSVGEAHGRRPARGRRPHIATNAKPLPLTGSCTGSRAFPALRSRSGSCPARRTIRPRHTSAMRRCRRA